MNVYELDGCTLELLYEPVTDAGRTANAAEFLRSYNKACFELVRTRFRLLARERAALDRGVFRLSELSRRCLVLIRVAPPDCPGAPALDFTLKDADAVAVAYGGDAAEVLYSYPPSPLRNDTPAVAPARADSQNTPQLPEEAHILLSLTAAADFCRRRRRSDLADMHMNEYRRVLAALSPDPLPPAGLRNLYAGGRWRK